MVRVRPIPFWETAIDSVPTPFDPANYTEELDPPSFLPTLSTFTVEGIVTYRYPKGFGISLSFGNKYFPSQATDEDEKAETATDEQIIGDGVLVPSTDHHNLNNDEADDDAALVPISEVDGANDDALSREDMINGGIDDEAVPT